MQPDRTWGVFVCNSPWLSLFVLLALAIACRPPEGPSDASTPGDIRVSRPCQDGRCVVLVAGDEHTCVLRVQRGEAECVGRNERGQIGDGTRVDRVIFTPV